MRIIIFIEGEYRIQPFMINELEAASHFFDKVFIVTKEMTSDISTAVLNNNAVSHIQVTQRERLKSRITNCYRWLTPLVTKQLKEACKDGILGADYLRGLYRHIADGYLFYNKALSIIETEASSDDSIYVISTWFSIEAFSVSLLKEKLNRIHSYSLAHSFEINKERDKYMAYYFNRFKHEHLDGLYFISKNMVDVYSNDSGHKFDSYSNKFFVEYLGSYKKFAANNPSGNTDLFTICSCSTVVPLKNLDLILDMLEVWEGNSIKWIHFGGGEKLVQMKQRANEIQNNNKSVSIELKGVTPNEQVQLFYSTEHIDLFISVSTTEGLPVSIMEAISYGIPVVATNVGGTKEVVQQNYGILLSPKPSISELKNAIEKITMKSKEEIVVMRNYAFEFWDSNFDAQKNMAAFYKKLLENNEENLNN